MLTDLIWRIANLLNYVVKILLSKLKKGSLLPTSNSNK